MKVSSVIKMIRLIVTQNIIQELFDSAYLTYDKFRGTF